MGYKVDKIFLVIQGDLCLERLTRRFQLFVYKRLFTLLGHMTNFVYKNQDTNTTITLGDLCLELTVKTNYGQKQLFVYKTLFTLLRHMTNFVYKSHGKNCTRR